MAFEPGDGIGNGEYREGLAQEVGPAWVVLDKSRDHRFIVRHIASSTATDADLAEHLIALLVDGDLCLRMVLDHAQGREVPRRSPTDHRDPHGTKIGENRQRKYLIVRSSPALSLLWHSIGNCPSKS